MPPRPRSAAGSRAASGTRLASRAWTTISRRSWYRSGDCDGVHAGDPGIRSQECDAGPLTPEAPMPVTGWDHVSFPARDPEAILDFYKRLGFETIHEEEFRSGKYPVF